MSSRKTHPSLYLLLFIVFVSVVFLMGSHWSLLHTHETKKDFETIVAVETPLPEPEPVLSKVRNVPIPSRDRRQPLSDVPEIVYESDLRYSLSAEGIWKTVDETYFHDAVFIGDSRTQGFQIQSGIKNATFFTAKGLMVNTALSKPVIGSGEHKLTVVDALKHKSFGKVYIMLGINELGWPDDSEFVRTYGKLIDSVKMSQPNAIVYIQSIINVSEEKSNKDPVYNNTNIAHYNALIQQLAIEKEVVYINLNEVLADPKGNLYKEASNDGVHLNPVYCKVWYRFLKTRAINQEV